MQPLRLGYSWNLGFTLLPRLWLKARIDRPETMEVVMQQGLEKRGSFSTSKTAADTRCYIPSEIFKLPDYAEKIAGAATI